MDEKEIKLNEKVKRVEKTLAEDIVTKDNLGDSLLEKEFRMNETAREILAKHKSKKVD